MTNLNDLTELTLPSSADELYIVNDPGGTPLDRKIRVDNILSGNHILGCKVTKAGAQTISNAVETAIIFDVEDWDNGEFHSTSVNSTNLIVPTGGAGIYFITGLLSFPSNSSGIRQVAIHLNGTAEAIFQMAAPGSALDAVTVSVLLDLADADAIKLIAYQDSGGNVDVSANAFSPTLSMIRIG